MRPAEAGYLLTQKKGGCSALLIREDIAVLTVSYTTSEIYTKLSRVKTNYPQKIEL